MMSSESELLAGEADVRLTAPARVGWTRWQRVLFRLGFCFWGLFCLDDAVSFCTWMWPWLMRKFEAGLDWPLRHLVLWCGHHVFYLSGDAAGFHPTGSGDTALNWIQMLVQVVLALLGCAVWSAFSEARGRRAQYRTLYAWLRLLMRFSLAGTLFGYGFEKVFPLQFPFPGVERLGLTYASSSPMGLLWRFIGFSTVYRVFGGLAEVVPAFLLLFRRTMTAGALLAAAVMANVVALNFGYDVPVKLYSSTLLLLALFLLLPDVMPMWRFFFAHRESRLDGVWLPRAERKPLRIASRCMQALTIGWLLYTTGWSSWQSWHGAFTPLRGFWIVDAAMGQPATQHWERINVRAADYVQAGPPDKLAYLPVKVDAKQRLLQILPPEDAAAQSPQAEFHWGKEEAGSLTLTGTWFGAPASIRMHRVTAAKSALETRGFHWVQEYPYNR